ncbi:MAG: EamA family transporter [Aestuariivirga sp.]|uniref:aromatic amino acid exporter YddG n=1 Tax=Aestuariivirga sp. TaxID=2650926 RepID=UPI0025C51427|nr:EamA family transporter [Aestuariivirga sp.]MCA3561370.1 EamA family transporter [Aestuariivirga sp.]
MQSSKATLVGFTAILMWASLALMSAASGRVPPFQLAAMTFLIGGLMGAVTWPFRGGAASALRQSWQVWLLGVAGLFGYHFVYFSAIRAAPAVEVSLIAYLWPLFLVVFSAFLPGEKLRLHHVAGVLLGLIGAALIITRGKGLLPAGGFSAGHALAFLCALIWAGYSVLSRRFGKVPTDVVAGYCLFTALLSTLCHMVFETTVWPVGPIQWGAVLGLGLLPVGAAFYTWDHGVKHGDIMVLGAASYASPLLSTLVLVTTGYAALTWPVAAACLLITLGAVIAAKDMLFRRVPAPT